MTTADEIYDNLGKAGCVSIAQSRQMEALRYAVGMLNEIRLTSDDATSLDVAEVALEGIKKRLTGEET